MLSIGRLGPGGGRYYTAQVASGAEDYYLGSGEAPGRWAGSGLAELGLEAGATVDPDRFARLLDGQHPRTGEALVAGGDGRVQGLDLTFSAPKSVSLLWALHPDPAVRQTVAEAHDRAVGDAIGFLESDAIRVRRGHNGVVRMQTSGLIAAGFAHRSSRAGDPQLHTHLVAANVVHGSDGRFSALDTRAIYRHARTAGYLYQARLRHELTATLGVGWGPVRSGQADLAGIDRDSLEAFSARRAEIVDALTSRGLSSANAARVAALDTRPAKPEVGDGPGLFERWRREAAEAGLDLAGLAGPGRSPAVFTDRAMSDLVGPGGLTAQASSFDRRDLLRALACAHPEGATLARLEQLAVQVTEREATVALTGESTDAAAKRWTTVDLLATEADLVRLAEQGLLSGAGIAGPAAVAAALADRPQLTGEQRQLVQGVCASPSGIVVVVGKAGTGKTFTFDACRAAWEADGIPVVGAALSARAAAELEAGSGIPSTTLARLLGDMDHPQGRPARGSVIIVDEAGMVGTRQLHRLAGHAARHGWKLVLAGDPRQLPEIDAGGAFTALAGRVPTWTLTTNVRQAERWEKAALDQLRDRQPAPAVAAYQRHGRVTVTDTAAHARDAMVADWHHAYHGGASTVMLAVRRADVESLNTAAQTLRVAAGELDPDTAVQVRGRRFMVGDEAICTRNDRRAGLTNGTRLTITALDPGLHIEGQTSDGRSLAVSWDYAEAGQLQLGYALTVHKAQGVTVDRAFLLGDDRLFAEAGYVGLSRARHANRLYIVAPPPPTHTLGGHRDIDGVIAALGVSQAQTISTRNAQPDRSLTGRSMRELIDGRHQLVEAICADMPPDPASRLAVLAETRQAIEAAPAGAAWVHDARLQLHRQAEQAAEQLQARQDWAARHRRQGQLLAQLTATIDDRLGQLNHRTIIDPPAGLVDLLGPPPENPLHRPGWAETAGKIAAWAQITDRPITDLPATTAPDRQPEQAWWAQARRALQAHQELELDLHQEKGLTL